MKLQRILTTVRNTELGDTALRLVALFKQEISVKLDSFLAENFKELESQANDLTISVKRDIALSRLEEADKERDKSIRVLDKLLKGYENIPVEELRDHAKPLVEIFKKYGVKILKESYASQSNFITSLLEDFSAERLKLSIEALAGMKEALADIKTKQDSFARIRQDYEAELVSNKEKPSASILRKPLLELINKKIIPYLVAMNIANPEMYKEFVAKSAEIINSTNDTVKGRRKKVKN